MFSARRLDGEGRVGPALEVAGVKIECVSCY
jgi:hypothetical protein